eukprot:10406127-Ditylum_brightwellii.AAC.1
MSLSTAKSTKVCDVVEQFMANVDKIYENAGIAHGDESDGACMEGEENDTGSVLSVPSSSDLS